MTGLHLPTLITVHAWVLAALTILVGALARMVKTPGPRYWFYSDLFGLLSIFAFYLILAQWYFSLLIFSISTYLTMYFRVLALCTPSFAKPFQKVGLVTFAVMLVVNVVLGTDETMIRTTMNSLIFATMCGCIIYVMFWASDLRNRFGRFLIFASTFAYMVVAVGRAINIVTTQGANVFTATTFNTVSSSVLMLLGVLAHIGFIIIVLDGINRAESEAAQAYVRESERRRHAEERERESLALADEQTRLIEVLTHEVRQPLNNASAALQSIGAELVSETNRPQNQAVVRAQSVIDQVGVALSNALIAATILERRRKFNPVRYDPMLLIDMMIMDFNEKERARIHVESTNAPLYVTADPVLLRIALRNLLDNALRYSDPGTDVFVRVSENETEMGAEFTIENAERNPDLFPTANIFGRRVRGGSPDTTGSGMGLYITSEIAKLHEGWVRTRHENGRRAFTLFIRD